MNPAEGLQHFSAACLIGLGLGLWYDFLRPLRPRFTWLSDLLFVAGLGYGWLHLGFGVCGADLRLGCSLGLLFGGILWEITAGQLFRRFFAWFWCTISFHIRIFLKKFKKFANFLLCVGKKAVTIKDKDTPSRKRQGGAYGKTETVL